MSGIDFKKLKALCDAATPGPWVSLESLSGPLWIVEDDDIVLAREIQQRNAEFIAAARTEMPKLIERIESQSKLLVTQGQEISCFGKENQSLKAEVERLTTYQEVTQEIADAHHDTLGKCITLKEENQSLCKLLRECTLFLGINESELEDVKSGLVALEKRITAILKEDK